MKRDVKKLQTAGVVVIYSDIEVMDFKTMHCLNLLVIPLDQDQISDHVYFMTLLFRKKKQLMEGMPSFLYLLK